MDTVAVCVSRYLNLALLGIAAICCGCGNSSRQGHADSAAASAIPTQTAANAPLSANDVSWLFSVPTRAQDFANLIAVRDITTPNPQDPTKRDPVWNDATFQQFLSIVNGPRHKSPAHRRESAYRRKRGSWTHGSSQESALMPVHPVSPATFTCNSVNCRKSA